jgi:hypothetical protein
MKKETLAQIDALAAQFGGDSVGSIDYGSNAKAVALQDAKVKERLGELLEKGYRLKLVQPRSGSGANVLNFGLTFWFERQNPKSAMDDTTAFTAIVELPTHAVRKILDGEMVSPTTPDAPFALATPSRSGEGVPIGDPLGGRRGRERDFLRDLLGRDIVELIRHRYPGLGVFNTYVDTMTFGQSKSSIETTVSTVGGDTRTGSDYTEDDDTYDNQIDGSNDAESRISLYT